MRAREIMDRDNPTMGITPNKPSRQIVENEVMRGSTTGRQLSEARLVINASIDFLDSRIKAQSGRYNLLTNNAPIVPLHTSCLYIGKDFPKRTSNRTKHPWVLWEFYIVPLISYPPNWRHKNGCAHAKSF